MNKNYDKSLYIVTVMIIFLGTLVSAVGLAGIGLPLPILITKAASFVILAFFAIYFDISFFKSIKNTWTPKRGIL